MLRRLAVLALLTVSGPAVAQDASDAILRLGRLENQVRQLSGQIEQLQFENRQLKEQVRKFQEDVEFRFQEGRGGAARQAGPSATTPSQPQGAATPVRPAQIPAATPQRRSDAFDPSQAPDAPGAPRPLGSTAASAPLAAAAAAGAPMPLPGAALSGIGGLIAEDEANPAAPLDLGQTGRTVAAPPAGQRPGANVATASAGDPRSDYDAAYAYLVQKQYEQAETGFRRFIQSHPRDRLVPEAMYWLGESYLQRNRTREAAEQFLNVSTEHPHSGRAPDALLKLGISLNALGARDRACAVFAELDRKYPQAGPLVKQGSEREQKRARCV
ncbi:MAG TPA: tol-pal system protein YbgF [Microvirga sp.]|nr:tol-pal system protein YbgF [Microvirga sp.]